MMLLIGASYNQDMHMRLRQANRLRKRILRAGGSVRPQVRPVKLKAGEIQRMVLRVLEGSESPLHVREVHSLVEERLRRPVSRDTVRSCLTEGVRLKRFGLERVGYGIYRLSAKELIT